MKQVLALLVATGLSLATGAPTPAQTPAAAGITATGKGAASATVTTAMIRVVERGVADQSGFVETLRAAGVEAPVLDHARAPAGMLILSVRGRLSNATPPRLDAVSAAVARYNETHNGTSTASINFFGPSADCPAIEQRAREAALADARRRATAIAAMNNTVIGGQLGVTESGGCPQPGPLGGAFTIDVATMSMRVAVVETVTFAVAK